MSAALEKRPKKKKKKKKKTQTDKKKKKKRKEKEKREKRWWKKFIFTLNFHLSEPYEQSILQYMKTHNIFFYLF